MSDQTVTQLVIDSDGATSGASQFSSAMDSVEAAAQKTLGSLSDLNGGLGDTLSGFTALGAGIVGGGIIAAMTGIIDYVVQANKSLADMQTTAKQVGLTLADFQGIQFGGQIAGLSTDQINDGLQKSASLLNDASRNSNSLSKELDANGLSVKNANGQLITQNQLLGIAAGLISNAQNPGDAAAIAQMLGFTKEWIPLLEQGAGAMGDLTSEAQAAGVVIDDATIQRAADFDDAWRKSSVEFSTYMKSAFSDLLPVVDNLIQQVHEFMGSFSKKDVQDAVDAALSSKPLTDAAGLPDDFGLKITIPQEAIDQWVSFGDKASDAAGKVTDKVGEVYGQIKEMANDPAVMSILNFFMAIQPLGPNGAGPYISGVVDTLKGGASSLILPSVEVTDPKTQPGYDASQITEPSYPSADQMDKAFAAAGNSIDATSQKAKDWAQDAAQDAADGFSKVADRASQANDILDRAENTIEKHTAQTIADTAAVGLGAAALAEYKAGATLDIAAKQNQTAVTQALADKFQDLAQDAGDAAAALAKAQVNSNISFGSQTAFLSPQDVQIATQLKGIYGNDIPAALASTEAAQMRVVNAQKSLNDAAGTFVTSFVQGIASGKSAVDSLVSSLSAVGSSLTSIGTKSLSSSLTTALGGGGLSFDPASLGIGAIGIGASLIGSFLGQDSAAKAALQQAQQQWAGMATQVTNFNLAAKGVALGPLTSELDSLLSTTSQLQAAAAKAQDSAGVASAGDNFNDAVVRIVGEFTAAATPLTALQTSIKGVNDEATGLKATLDQLGYGMDSQVDAAAQAQIQALIAQFSQTVSTGLTSRLNTAQGNSYLNDAQTVLTNHQQDLSDAAELGDPASLMAQISATFAAEAQQVVNNAGLVGTSFNSFIKLFPQFAGVVTESATAVTAANTAFAAIVTTIDSYLASVQLGSDSILSPQDQLNAAQSQFNAQLSLAQQGNSDALGSITQYAGTLLDQAKSFYASSAGYTGIYDAVTAALQGLTTMPTPGLAMGGLVPGFASGGIVGNGTFGVDSVLARFAGGGNIALAGGEHITRASSVNAATLPMLSAINTTGRVPGNDNSTQTSALSQVFAQVGRSQIITLQNGFADLGNRVDRLAAAVRDNKPKADRPASKGSR